MANREHSRSAGRILIALAIMLARPGMAAAQEGSRDEHNVPPSWLAAVSGFSGFLGAVAGAAITIWGAYRSRFKELDQSVHDKRLESYPRLVKAAAPLAIYFPAGDLDPWVLGPDDCRAIGRAMSEWYFDGGGLLLSVPARRLLSAGEGADACIFSRESPSPDVPQERRGHQRRKTQEVSGEARGRVPGEAHGREPGRAGGRVPGRTRRGRETRRGRGRAPEG